MKTFLLERIYKNNKITLGRLWVKDQVFYTMELPDKNNTPNISCIPVGVYSVVKEYSPHFNQDLWELKGVPNRSEIKIHAANFVQQLKGCIALGMNYKDINKDGIIDLSESKKAINKFHSLVTESFKLEIIWNIK